MVHSMAVFFVMFLVKHYSSQASTDLCVVHVNALNNSCFCVACSFLSRFKSGNNACVSLPLAFHNTNFSSQRQCQANAKSLFQLAIHMYLLCVNDVSDSRSGPG